MITKHITEATLLNMIHGLEGARAEQVEIPGCHPSWVIHCTPSAARKIIDIMDRSRFDWPLLIRVQKTEVTP